MRNRFSPWVVIGLVALGGTAQAAEPEKVVVRNRLYSPEGTVEAGAQVGFAVINRLVDHTNFQATGAYNFTNEWAAELFAGYAYSKHTSIADQVTSEVASHKLSTSPTTDDFPSMWEMKWNVAAGARWAPIYGKLSLSSEIPVHFQAYIGAGGGVAGLDRTSVVYCMDANPPAKDDSGNPTCASPLVEKNRIAPMAQFGGGLRFFVGQHVALRLEARDYTFPDKYQVDIDRTAASNGSTNAGTQAPNPGFQHVVFLTAGLSYVF